MKNKKKLVSICIPVFNSEKFLEKTLETIINQSYKNIEILIGDNGSTDSTSKIVKEYVNKDKRIRYIVHEKNLGYSGNCNYLILQAVGEYIGIYHSDDLYDPNIVELQVEALENNLNLAGVFTFGVSINEKDEVLKELDLLKKREDIIEVNFQIYIKNLLNEGKYFNNILICPTSMIRKKIYIEFNGYNESLKYIEDQDMWTRILEKYQLGIINKKLIKYRVHKNQGSNDYIRKTRNDIQLFLKYTEKIINKKIKNNQEYRNYINVLISKDYLNIALNKMWEDNFNDFKKFILKSKEIKKLKNFSKHTFFQNFIWTKSTFKVCSKIIKLKKN